MILLLCIAVYSEENFALISDRFICWIYLLELSATYSYDYWNILHAAVYFSVPSIKFVINICVKREKHCCENSWHGLEFSTRMTYGRKWRKRVGSAYCIRTTLQYESFITLRVRDESPSQKRRVFKITVKSFANRLRALTRKTNLFRTRESQRVSKINVCLLIHEREILRRTAPFIRKRSGREAVVTVDSKTGTWCLSDNEKCINGDKQRRVTSMHARMPRWNISTYRIFGNHLYRRTGPKRAPIIIT